MTDAPSDLLIQQCYFFGGDRYIRVTRGGTGAGIVDPGYPLPISTWGWPSGFGTNGIDAALWSGTKCYFFDGDRYIRVTRGDTGAGTVDPGYPLPISTWDWPPGFGTNGISDALSGPLRTDPVLVRRNVYELGKTWSDPVLWYARGVGAMKARALADQTSWRFIAAIHGFDRRRWEQVGYLSADDILPSASIRAEYWNQCQHGSWYFLPWHRGYLLDFEAIVRSEITALGGPPEWSLPYWNYFKTGQNALPPEFATPEWPDGEDDNPLFEPQRFGPQDDGQVYVPLSAVNLNAMSDPNFTGVASGGSPGFGGVDTGFSHGGPVHGGIETQPHDMVHVLVGGASPTPPNGLGLMTDPRTAGLDPIFWLHHANIDRLWASWNSAATHPNPDQPSWVLGPAASGERGYVMPAPGGAADRFTPGEMVDPAVLRCRYQDLDPGTSLTPVQDDGARRQPQALSAERPPAVLLGANAEQTPPVLGAGITTTLQLEGQVGRPLSSDDGGRYFLNLENVQGTSDAAAFSVHLIGADGTRDVTVGGIAPFGVSEASDPDGDQAGAGLTFVLDVTSALTTLMDDAPPDLSSLEVRLVPVNAARRSDVVVGRVSLYREGG